jgi:hypothetical protein
MGACYGGKEEKGQNHGGSMMKKKNLEPIKGNKFTPPPLQYGELNQISKVIKIKIGHVNLIQLISLMT